VRSTFSTRLANSSSWNIAVSAGRSHDRARRSSTGVGSATARSSSTSRREIRSRSICAGSPSGCLPRTLGLAAISASRSGYALTSSAAVLSPTPATPGMLSLVSPRSARKSASRSGGTPNFSITAARVYVCARIASITAVCSPTSCIRSLSAE
jgi:hypothetical protein